LRWFRKLDDPSVTHKIYIHVGLHKTGTTALQSDLHRNAGWLREKNIFIPRSGCLSTIGSGHHNIAWQIAKDRRFDPSFGDLASLAIELDGIAADVVLSSEDFESVLTAPESLRTLLVLGDNARRQVVVVLYLRNQVSYLESLFQEMVVHGFGDTADAFVGDILRGGAVRVKDWIFHFDYFRIAGVLRSLSGAQVIIRSYEELGTMSVTVDFLAAIGLVYQNGLHDSRLNKCRDLGDTFTLFYRNRLEREPSASEALVLEHLASWLRGKRCAVGPQIEAAFYQAFAASNARVCCLAGLPPDALSRHPVEVGSVKDAASVNLERLFSFETQRGIATVAAVLDASQSPGDRDRLLSAAEEHLFESWARR
jgi:hypothetical protein